MKEAAELCQPWKYFWLESFSALQGGLGTISSVVEELQQTFSSKATEEEVLLTL